MTVVSGKVRSMHWAGAARGAAAALLALALGACLTACVTEGGSRGKESSGPVDPKELDRRAQIHMELASGYFSRGQTSDALDEVKQALAARPDLASAYALRGLVYGAMNETGKADESFRQALQLAPHDADTMHNYGWYLCQQKRYPEADAQFAQALAEPTYRGASRTLLAQGVCQARAGRMADAEHTLSHSYELDPANPTTAVNLAEVLYKRGEYERARFYIRRVNTKDELVSAQTLWLAARIERKLGQDAQVADLGAQLRKRFPQAPETLLFEKGKFDE
jgi:type IV pilus assembly protein PilF